MAESESNNRDDRGRRRVGKRFSIAIAAVVAALGIICVCTKVVDVPAGCSDADKYPYVFKDGCSQDSATVPPDSTITPPDTSVAPPDSTVTPPDTSVVPPDSSVTTLIDARDGMAYKTVIIGDQTWMAENLRFKSDSSFFYNNDSTNYAKYGRLYAWEDARKVCPDGWKLPDTTDWNKLVDTVGGENIAGEKLKSVGGWKENGDGTDNFGFSALPGGYRSSSGEFDGEGEFGYWWTTTEHDKIGAFSIIMRHYDTKAEHDWEGSKSIGNSVRCFKENN